MVSTHWENGSGRTIFAVVTTDDLTMFANHRLGYDAVTHVTIRGVAGFIRTLADEPSYVGLVWHDSGLTYTFGSQGFEATELLTFVEQLRPATQEDWDAMRAQVTPPPAVVDSAPASTSASDRTP